jgi:hypothetical protein
VTYGARIDTFIEIANGKHDSDMFREGNTRFLNMSYVARAKRKNSGGGNRKNTK